MPLSTLYETSEGRIGHDGPLLVTHMRESTTHAFLDALDQAQAQLVAKYPKISSINVMTQASMKADEAMRTRSVELTAKYDAHGLGTAIVVLSRGLAGVSVRTALSMYFMVSTAQNQTKVFSSVAEGLGWLHGLPGQDALVRMVSPTDIEHFLK